MDTLRLILLVLGIAVIILVYFLSRKAAERSDYKNKQDPRFFNVNEPVLTESTNTSSDTPDLVSHEDDPIAVSDDNFDDELLNLSELIQDAARESVQMPDESTSRQSQDVINEHEEPVVLKNYSLLVNGNIVVIHLMSKDTAGFQGRVLHDALQMHHLEFGRMGIFHYHRSGETIFSLANMKEPGTFRLDKITTFCTTGVSLFMQLDKLSEPVEMFEEMLLIAGKLADHLDGYLCDAQRSSLTKQTVTYLMDEIKQYTLHRS